MTTPHETDKVQTKLPKAESKQKVSESKENLISADVATSNNESHKENKTNITPVLANTENKFNTK